MAPKVVGVSAEEAQQVATRLAQPRLLLFLKKGLLPRDSVRRWRPPSRSGRAATRAFGRSIRSDRWRRYERSRRYKPRHRRRHGPVAYGGGLEGSVPTAHNAVPSRCMCTSLYDCESWLWAIDSRRPPVLPSARGDSEAIIAFDFDQTSFHRHRRRHIRLVCRHAGTAFDRLRRELSEGSVVHAYAHDNAPISHSCCHS